MSVNNNSSTAVIVRQGEMVNAKKGEKIPQSFEFTTDMTNEILLSPDQNERIVLNVVLILGDGTTGTVKVYRETANKTILPCYFSNASRVSTSSELNLKLNFGEKVLVTSTGRGNNQTFIGLGYNIETEAL